jgi:hypothetical protein
VLRLRLCQRIPERQAGAPGESAGGSARGAQHLLVTGGEREVGRRRHSASYLLPLALRFDQQGVVHSNKVDLTATTADEFARG